ncbi:MAG: HsdR family type I site-specific deoxyribonuclease [Spirochaetota bacterium]
MAVGKKERETQNRVIQLFCKQLGYEYLGNWIDRSNNSNIEEQYLTAYLKKAKYSQNQISDAIYKLKSEADNQNNSLYTVNKNVYGLLRYGVKIKERAEENYTTVHLINWQKPEKNHFAIAEEVTVHGKKDKRPDIVLYVNGIALAVLELKRSTVSIGEGIRQNITNQSKEYIERFFTTIQYVFAGQDMAGLRYGAIGTQEKFFLNWKEDIQQESKTLLLDKYLLKMCAKQRFLEVIYDFVLFDAGKKKLPRPHQYFGIKAAQEHVKIKASGIIWHTQGSGKSIVMVLLAKWILENNPNARIVIITDRDELDKQIEGVFQDAGEQIKRSKSGRELLQQLQSPSPRLFCSLVHKFQKKDVDFDTYIEELKNNPPSTHGELFVFVDECHRTQSGKLNIAMKTILKEAVFIGFTGTPLLKKDKKTSLEIFGVSPINKSPYIHTYKFNEGVIDKVVLDLIYEKRDVDQELTSQSKVDEWFNSKTRNLNEYQKAKLRQKWGTMQNVLSAKERIQRIVNEVAHDFETKPRISEEKGNAILVASSIYDACRYFKLFQETELKNKCAIVTSYNPTSKRATTEETGANTQTEHQFILEIYQSFLKIGTKTDGESIYKSAEKHEDEVKTKFIKEPTNMKVLIVVDKLLTGFDAPGCTYLYIDKSMQDHGLFQAICRTNRIDSDDKEYGYIIDFKDLFSKVEGAISVYTAELDQGEEKKDEAIYMQERLKIQRERLDITLAALETLIEPLQDPMDEIECIRYFCGNAEITEDLKSKEYLRISLYSGVAAFLRAYANIAGELELGGYDRAECKRIPQRAEYFARLRDEIKNVSGEHLDTKPFEADMRNLLDMYIKAEDARIVSKLDDMPLIELIVNSGMQQAIKELKKKKNRSNDNVAENIEQNVRSRIIQDYLINPQFHEKMSLLLKEIIQERKMGAMSYEKYLQKIEKLIQRLKQGKSEDVPETLDTPAKVALYNNLKKDEKLALRLYNAIVEVKKDGFRSNEPKEKEIKAAMFSILKDIDVVEHTFEIVKMQSEF